MQPNKYIFKIFFIFLSLLMLHNNVLSQSFYGNEWINYDQNYLKIKISKEGIYRINYNQLNFSLNQINTNIIDIDPRNIQIFHNGQEQYIYLKGENDGNFDTDDYIEFYANQNDGKFDSLVYRASNIQANDNYSLFNDTATYYFTWNSLPIKDNKSPNKRLTNSNETNFNSYPNLAYFTNHVRKNFTFRYIGGSTYYNQGTEVEYVEGEGWFGDTSSRNNPRFETGIPTPNIYNDGGNAKIEIAVIGTSNYRPENPDHNIIINYKNFTINELFEGYSVQKYTRSHPALSALNNGISTFSFYSNTASFSSDNPASYTVAYIDIHYPHSMDMEGYSTFMMILKGINPGKKTLKFLNYNATSNDSVVIYDFNEHKRIKATWQNNYFNAIINDNDTNKICYLYNLNNYKTPDAIIPLKSKNAFYTNASGKFTNFNNLDKNYLIISHPILYNPALQYSQYRNQQKDFKALLVNVEELYDQFAYGINKHPLAIRNFCHFALNHFSTRPEYLFLFGKAYNATLYRNNKDYYSQTLVPSFGNPPSDILFTSRLDGTTNGDLYKPAIATGRLSAKSTYEAYNYLEKVKQYELAQTSPEEWMKIALHFGGGNDYNEQNQLANYLKSYENILTDTLFGGKVHTFLKSSSDPIQNTASSYLRQLINGGVSLMTFFGHGAGFGFDQNIDHPSEYNNYGKYPFIIANSCLSGDIYSEIKSYSEEFILIQDKGAIGYLGSISLSLKDPLHKYSLSLYNNISKQMYGNSIGKQIQASLKQLMSDINSTGGNFHKETYLDMALHGDPAIKINHNPLPDYFITKENIFSNPEIITNEINNFELNIIVGNQGKAISDSLIIEVNHIYPNGITTKTYSQSTKAPLYKDTIKFIIPTDILNTFGLNKFQITIDPLNKIQESSKNNNYAQTELQFISEDISPIYPKNFAIVPTSQISLKATTSNLFAPEQNYIFQIDTSFYFNSPLKKETTITNKGGVINWKLPFNLTDSTVYYWRVANANKTNGKYNWQTRSFQYIQGKTGWSQAHYDQFRDDNYVFVQQNLAQRNYKFQNLYKQIKCSSLLETTSGIWDIYKVFIDQSEIARYHCTYGGFNVVILDSMSITPWVSPRNQAIAYNAYDDLRYRGIYFNDHCRTIGDLNYFDYRTSITSTSSNPADDFNPREKLRSLILDIVPKNSYVLIYSHQDTKYGGHYHMLNSDTTLYQAFESIGSKNIRNIPNEFPYIILGKKGAPIGSAREIIANSSNETIELIDSIETKWKEGTITSTLIGPASNWNSLHWRFKTTESNNDIINLGIIGIKADGTSDTVAQNISPEPQNLDLLNLKDIIDASIYPYMRLYCKMKDDITRTPPQFSRWQVIFDEIPETAINPSHHYYLSEDTIQEGNFITLSFATENISSKDMDSLLISYWVVNKDRVSLDKIYHRKAKHPAGSYLIDTVSISTIGLSGNNYLWAEVNPINPKTKQYDQLEQYHFNNIIQIPFYVDTDKTNPLLDVTFDGIRILDEDIVSAKPLIEVRLKDENKYLALNDTNAFKIFIHFPNEYAPRRVFFTELGKENMLFIPATLPENTAKIEYKPTLPDGKYSLLVQAKDISNNESGNIDYNVTFEVINKPSITNVINWPNPFSTKTHFVFTLTGSELPEYMKIQILTVTGKIVKEIDLSELGSIHIGRNITQYAWDGKDEFGDQLANGVYLYRVITKLNGSQIDLRQTKADNYFNNNFGKMYLLR